MRVRLLFSVAMALAAFAVVIIPIAPGDPIAAAVAAEPACEPQNSYGYFTGFFTNFYTGTQPEHWNGASVNMKAPTLPVLCANTGPGNTSSAWVMLVGSDTKHYMQAGIYNVHDCTNALYCNLACHDNKFSTWGQSNLDAGNQNWWGPCVTPDVTYHAYVETYPYGSGQRGRIVVDGNVIFSTVFDPFSYISAPAIVQFAEETHKIGTRVPGTVSDNTEFAHLQVETNGYVWDDACNHIHMTPWTSPETPFYAMGARTCDDLYGWDSRG
jgi:hypothetical protein